MNEQTFEQLIDRMHRYVDTLSTESIDMEQVLLQLIQATNIVFASVAPIDLPPLHETQQQTLGHRLVNFRGDLKVPEIEKDHVIPIDRVTEQDEDFSLDLSWLFGLPLGWAGIKALTARIKNSRRTSQNNRRRVTQPTTRKKQTKKKLRKRSLRTPLSKKQRGRIQQKQQVYKEPSNRKLRQAQRANIPDKIKSRLIKKYPTRFKLDTAGDLLEIDGKKKPKLASLQTIDQAIEQMLEPRFATGLKVLRRVAGAAGLAFVGYDLYRLYDIYSDPELDDDDKTTQSGPIIGQMLGASGGAIVGALAGSVVGPWGTFFGAIAGGLTGSLAGDKLGEWVADWIVERDPPDPPAGKSWESISPEETREYLQKKEYYDSLQYGIGGSYAPKFNSQPTESKIKPNVNSTNEQPPIRETEKKIIPIDRSDQPPLTPQEEDILLEQNPQIQQIDDKISTMIERFIIDKNRLDDQHKQIVRDIEQLV